MMLVARMIIAKPSAIRLYTQPTASPPTMRSTNWETLRAPIAPPLACKDRGLTKRRETARTARLVYPTVGCEWVRPELTAGSAMQVADPPSRQGFADDEAAIEPAPAGRNPS